MSCGVSVCSSAQYLIGTGLTRGGVNCTSLSGGFSWSVSPLLLQ